MGGNTPFYGLVEAAVWDRQRPGRKTQPASSHTLHGNRMLKTDNHPGPVVAAGRLEDTIEVRRQTALLKAGVPHNWWCVDLCFWPNAWDVTADSKVFLDKLRRKYAAA